MIHFINYKKEHNEKRIYNWSLFIWDKLRQRIRISAYSGFNLGIRISTYEDGYQLSIGHLFGAFGIAYRPKTMRYMNDRKTFLSLDVHGGCIYWKFNVPTWSWSSKTPKWRDGSFDMVRFIVGKQMYFKEDALGTSYQNVRFKFRGKEYVADEVKFERKYWFKSRIPFDFYHTGGYYCDIKISNPPRRAGKGENSYDCDDDGSFGLHFPWSGETPSYKNKDACLSDALAYYCINVAENIQKYGRAKGDNLPHDVIGFKYIGLSVKKGARFNEQTGNAQSAETSLQ